LTNNGIKEKLFFVFLNEGVFEIKSNESNNIDNDSINNDYNNESDED